MSALYANITEKQIPSFLLTKKLHRKHTYLKIMDEYPGASSSVTGCINTLAYLK